MKKINTLLILMFVIGCFSICSAQMYQLKGIQFYDQSGDWPLLDKASRGIYETKTTSDNGTNGAMIIEVHKSSKLEGDDAAIKNAFDTHVSENAWNNKETRTLTKTEKYVTRDMEQVTAYRYEGTDGETRIWSEVWLLHWKEKDRTFIFTAVAKNDGSGVSEKIISDLSMMLGTIDVIED